LLETVLACVQMDTQVIIANSPMLVKADPTEHFARTWEHLSVSRACVPANAYSVSLEIIAKNHLHV